MRLKSDNAMYMDLSTKHFDSNSSHKDLMQKDARHPNEETRSRCGVCSVDI